MNARRVSVVVPTCNRPALLREALASIRARETESVTFEILVGDNGADPQTRVVAEEFGARYLPVSRRGAGAARNAGLDAATGEFIAFLDDDDVWLDGAVHGHLALLDARPDLDGAFSKIISTDPQLRPLSEPWPGDDLGEGDELVLTMLSGYYPQIGGTLIRASVRDAIGRFDESLLGDQDWDWQLRLARRRKTGFVAAPTVHFRQRAPGSFDKLRLMRLGFTRRVFLRHALPERRLFRMRGGFLGAYTKVVWQYYEYFVDAAGDHARMGDRAGARLAVWGAFRTFPMRACFHMLRPTPLRAALFSRRTRPHVPEAHADALRK